MIKLANEGRTIRDIAKIVHMSLKDICEIIRKATGDEDPNKEEKEKEQQKLQKLKKLSPYAQAFQMFKDNQPLANVAIELDLKTDAILNFHGDYLRLVRMNGLVSIYQELKNDFPLFFHLHRRIKNEGLNKQDITDLLENQHKLVDLDKIVTFYNNRIRGQQSQKLQLEKEINRLSTKRDTYVGLSV